MGCGLKVLGQRSSEFEYSISALQKGSSEGAVGNVYGTRNLLITFCANLEPQRHKPRFPFKTPRKEAKCL